MDMQGIIKWAKTAAIAALGGGIAAAVAAAMDPSKWRFPQDLGSGKLIPFFLTGAGTAFLAMLIKSPLGQQVIQSYRDSTQQAKDDAAMLDKVKSDIKAGAVGPASQPPSGPATK